MTQITGSKGKQGLFPSRDQKTKEDQQEDGTKTHRYGRKDGCGGYLLNDYNTSTTTFFRSLDFTAKV
ncbi:MAG: hypothetical protein NZL95_09710 [Chitinophagales bacterium]|nr:hypothetical protein [Chitinophagales bacterium]MDW8428809.1 hypothetical protein [Chitinophagales bacterium]